MKTVEKDVEFLNKKQDIEEGIIKALKAKTDPKIGDDAIMLMISSDLDYLIRTNKKHLTHFNYAIFNIDP